VYLYFLVIFGKWYIICLSLKQTNNCFKVIEKLIRRIE